MSAAALRYEDALRAAHAWHDAPDADAFPVLVLESLQGLVEAEAVGWNEFDTRTGRLNAVVVPDDGLTRDLGILESLAHEHPLIVHILQDPLSKPVTISDFRSRRELHRLELYHEFFKPHGIEYQCSFGIAGDGYVGVALNRATRDFTPEERAFLDLLRPHLVSAYASVRARAEARERLERVERALENAGREVVVLGRGGRLEHASLRARRLLRGHDLDSFRSLELVTPEGRVTVRRVDGDPVLLLVDEVAQPRLDSERVAAFRLTRREAEILSLVALGHTSEQIATILSVSARTVDKHVEHALEKLGVGSRREAVALVLAEPPG
jgi:DNA-binding CsgD family transcriptional regulator